jgi:hypothetical protein
MMRGFKFTILLSGLACVSASAMAGNLMVEVRIEGQSTAGQQGIGAGIGEGGWGLLGRQRSVTRRDTNVQRLLVMDGGTATLSSVQTQPLRLRQVILGPYGKVVSEGYVYRSLGGGVRVTPHLRGEMVDIEVSAEEAKPVPGQYQRTEVMQLSTQINGRTGEWIMLGDDQRGASGGGSRAGGAYDSNAGSGGAAIRRDDYSSGQTVWLRVTPAGD